MDTTELYLEYKEKWARQVMKTDRQQALIDELVEACGMAEEHLEAKPEPTAYDIEMLLRLNRALNKAIEGREEVVTKATK